MSSERSDSESDSDDQGGGGWKRKPLIANSRQFIYNLDAEEYIDRDTDTAFRHHQMRRRHPRHRHHIITLFDDDTAKTWQSRIPAIMIIAIFIVIAIVCGHLYKMALRCSSAAQKTEAAADVDDDDDNVKPSS
jgi:hypothetical protein